MLHGPGEAQVGVHEAVDQLQVWVLWIGLLWCAVVYCGVVYCGVLWSTVVYCDVMCSTVVCWHRGLRGDAGPAERC